MSYFGYYVGKIDGSLGASTREALKKFQKKAGLTITGELSISQADFLLKYEVEEETKKLDAFANRLTKNPVAPTSSKTSTENKEKTTLNDKGGITKGRSPPAKLVELAKAQTFIGKFGGQWFGVMTCDMLRYKKELTYEIALRIDGKKTFIDNGPGKDFTLEGSIATESM